MIIEMRTYKTKPGLRSRFLEIFRSKSIPAHAEIGMKILGPFLSVEAPDTFFFMRGFPGLASGGVVVLTADLSAPRAATKTSARSSPATHGRRLHSARGKYQTL